MSEESILELIEQLRTGVVDHVEIEKEGFLNFRAKLIQQDDFKQFIERQNMVEIRYIIIKKKNKLLTIQI